MSSRDPHPDADGKCDAGAHRAPRVHPLARKCPSPPAAETSPVALLQGYDSIASEITRLALDGDEPTALLDRVTHLVAQTLNTSFCVVLRYHPAEEERLILLSATGWDRDVSALFTSSGKASSVLSQALKATEAVRIEDLKSETCCQVSRALTDSGAVSGLCAAIPGPDQPLGVLAVFTKNGRQFGDDECRFLRTVANLLAVTVGSKYANEPRRHSHEKIAQAKREWESTVDSLPGFVVCLLDRHGHIVRANRAVERWALGRVDDVKSKALHELLHPRCNNPQCYLRHLTRRGWEDLSQGLTVEIEAEDALLNRYLRIQLRPILAHPSREGSRLASAAVAVIHDITKIKEAEKILRDAKEVLEREVSTRTADLVSTNQKLVTEVEERKRVERELWESRERYRLLIDTMNEGFAGQNADGALTYVNNRLCDMLAYTREELLGRPITDFSDPASRDLMDKRLCGRDDCEGCQGGHFEIEWVRKDGTRIYTNVSPQPIHDPDGKSDGCFAVITDLTDRRRAEEKLRRSENELRLLSAQLLTAQEVERKRIAGELHDGIGQSLSALKFCLENSLGLFERYGIERGMPVLKGLIPKMQQEIEEVRRISMGLRPSTLDDLGIVPTIAWFCREFRGIYRNIHLDTRINVEEHQVPTRLKTVVYRILQEALNNVIKHAKADTVRVDLSCTDSVIVISISDNGLGFDIDKITDHAGSGMGMGLSSMKERAENSGGTLSIVSARNSGTRIQASWPCHGTA
jgi:PAS domain S-box-containing protein